MFLNSQEDSIINIDDFLLKILSATGEPNDHYSKAVCCIWALTSMEILNM